MKLSKEVNCKRKPLTESEKLDMRSLRKGVIFLLVSQLVVILLPSKSHAADSLHNPLPHVSSYYHTSVAPNLLWDAEVLLGNHT